VSREHVRTLERGGADPTIGMLQKIARALCVWLVNLVQ
jgi:hypothetical protein